MSPNTKTDGPAGDFVFGDAIIPSGVPGGQAIRGASIRTLVDYSIAINILIVKRRFGHLKTRYRGVRKNSCMLCMAFALADLAMCISAGRSLASRPEAA